MDKRLCILEHDTEPHDDAEWIQDKIRRMPSISDAFVCATNFLAFQVIASLKTLRLKVPEDVMVTGFDDTPQAAAAEPTLTAVHIPSADFGRIAANILLNRIQHPERPFCTTYIRTIPLWRKSAER